MEDDEDFEEHRLWMQTLCSACFLHQERTPLQWSQNLNTSREFISCIEDDWAVPAAHDLREQGSLAVDRGAHLLLVPVEDLHPVVTHAVRARGN